MTSPKRLRGRPRGSGKDDNHALTLVANYLVRDASLKPTTAMKRVLRTRKEWGATDASLLRRWQVKWKTQGEALLAAAQERRKLDSQLTPSYAGNYLSLGGSLQSIERIAEQYRRFEALFKSSPLEEAMQRAMRWEEQIRRELKPLETVRRELKAQEDINRALRLYRVFGPFGG